MRRHVLSFRSLNLEPSPVIAVPKRKYAVLANARPRPLSVENDLLFIAGIQTPQSLTTVLLRIDFAQVRRRV